MGSGGKFNAPKAKEKGGCAATGRAAALLRSGMVTTNFARGVCAVVLAAVGAGCGEPPPIDQRVGDEMAAQVIREMPVLADTALDAWLDSLGTRIAGVTGPSEFAWHFTVIDRDDPNAFAIPGGHVFVHRGLLALASDMSEVAGVLGHEVAHITLGHSATQQGRSTRANFVVAAFCAITGWCSSGAAQVAIELGGAAWMARHSRADEAASDSASIEYLVRAGIDPGGVARMFARLAAERASRPGVLEQFFSTHPLDDERVAAAQALTRRKSLEQRSLQADDSVFRRVRPDSVAN